ncbi:MAG: hypothetical protein ACFFB0_17945 [Promethearchaeota archaeon]
MNKDIDGKADELLCEKEIFNDDIENKFEPMDEPIYRKRKNKYFMCKLPLKRNQSCI